MQKRMLSQLEFNGLVGKICRDIQLDSWKPDLIVGISRGGMVPAIMISHYFDVQCVPLSVSLRDHPSTEYNCWLSADAYMGKNILVVDDINDSGATLNWIVDSWQQACLPSNTKWEFIWNDTVRFATIVDNTASDFDHAIDYCGFEINKAEDDYWIDFPYERWWITV